MGRVGQVNSFVTNHRISANEANKSGHSTICKLNYIMSLLSSYAVVCRRLSSSMVVVVLIVSILLSPVCVRIHKKGPKKICIQIAYIERANKIRMNWPVGQTKNTYSNIIIICVFLLAHNHWIYENANRN